MTGVFTGKERDVETGLDYFGARYLSSAQGRFTSPDAPFGAQKSEIPQTWNLYTYGRNNPLYFVDPDGRQELGPMCSDGNQQCMDRVGQGTGEVLKGFAKGVVNGVASFLDFVSCPICQPHGDVLPAVGTEQQVGNVAGQLVGAVGAGKAVGMMVGAAAEAGAAVAVSEAAPTGGRLGSAATRAQNSAIADSLESRGFKVTGGGGRLPEEHLPGPGGGTKGGTFVDITAVRDGRTVRVQTIDTRADGVTPTAREAAAAARIRAQQQPRDHTVLIPKRK